MNPKPPSTAEFRRAEAAFVISPDAASIAGVVAASVQLLEAGVDTPHVRMLAGDDRASTYEIEKDFRLALDELGLEPLDYRGAVLEISRELVGRVLANEVRPSEVAPKIWSMFSRVGIGFDWPTEFTRLAMAADAVEDQSDYWDTGPEFMAAARAFVDVAD